MIRNPFGLLAVVTSALALGACGSARLGGPPPAQVAAAPRPGPGPVYNAPEPVVEAAPAAPVSSAPLPPPPGVAAAPPPSLGAPPPGPVVADVPALPASAPVQAAPAAPAPAAPQPVVQAASPGRSAALGGWTARDASGTCRVQLSSTPALDLYRASAGACANRDLARVTAWDYRDGEVYLYQPGGAVAARLRPAGGSLEGVLAKSGAPLTLVR